MPGAYSKGGCRPELASMSSGSRMRSERGRCAGVYVMCLKVAARAVDRLVRKWRILTRNLLTCRRPGVGSTTDWSDDLTQICRVSLLATLLLMRHTEADWEVDMLRAFEAGYRSAAHCRRLQGLPALSSFGARVEDRPRCTEVRTGKGKPPTRRPLQ